MGKDNYAAQITDNAKYVKKPNSEIMRWTNRIIKYIGFTLIPVGIALFCKQVLYRAYTVSKSHSRKKYKYSTNKGLVQPLKKGYTNTAVRSFPLCRWLCHLRRYLEVGASKYCRFLFSDKIIQYKLHLYNMHYVQNLVLLIRQIYYIFHSKSLV